MVASAFQTAVIQQTSKDAPATSRLPLTVTTKKPIPHLPSPHHVLVRVHAVGLNPTDWKMITHFFMEGNTPGCDFAGVVDSVGAEAAESFPPGTRVCGADFPYRPNNKANGAFQQWCLADSRQLLKLPGKWSDVNGAALGAIGWGTVCMALSDDGALALKGTPKSPDDSGAPVLVYGGATATGLMAIQMLKLSGYTPIAVCSESSAPLCIKYGAIGTASYTDSDCVRKIKELSKGIQIKHALDCITDADSAAACFASLSRVGGRYACLENCPEQWRTRRAVKVKVVMGFEMQGNDVDLGHPTYARKASKKLFDIGVSWTKEMQGLLDQDKIQTQPVHEVKGGFEGILEALEMLRRGDSKGKKLVVNIADI